MKKILTLLFTLTLPFAALAQYEYGEPVPVKGSGISMKKARFGLFFAPNNSWMKATSSKSNDGLYLVNSEGSKVGYTWGLMMDFFFAENYGIATGFQLNTTGGKMNAQYNTAVVDPPNTQNLVKSAYFDYRLQYFEIPFGLKMMSDNIGSGLRVFGNIGITLGVNIAKKATYEVVYTDTMGSGTNLTDKTVSGENEKLRGGLSITPILFQMNLGAGIEYQLTDKLSFYTGFFFNNGFAPDVTTPKEIKMNYKGTFSDANTRLNNFSLKVGLFF